MSSRTEIPESYNRNYFNRIAHSYDRHRTAGGPHDAVLHALWVEAQSTRVLEIGSGTGNSTIAFGRLNPCSTVGLDVSSAMIREAAGKNIDAQWVNGDAQSLPLRNGSFDFVYSVLAFHLIPDSAKCIRECYRVLRSGAMAIVTSPEEFIRTHVLDRYFPSFSRIDLARFQSEHLLESQMKAVGFTRTNLTYCATPPKPIDAAYVEKIENRFISTFALIPDDEFSAGLKHLKRDIAETGQLDEPMIWRSVVVSGCKE